MWPSQKLRVAVIFWHRREEADLDLVFDQILGQKICCWTFKQALGGGPARVTVGNPSEIAVYELQDVCECFLTQVMG